MKKDNSKPVWNQTFSQQKNHLLPPEIQRNIIIGDDLATVKKVMMLEEITNLNCEFIKENLRARLVHCNDYYMGIGINITRNTLS